MIRLYRAFIDPIRYALATAGIALLGAGLVAWGAWSVTIAHERRAFRERECAAKLEALHARNPFVERFLLPSDPCVALAVLKGDSR